MDLKELNGAQRAILEQAVVSAFTRTSLAMALEHHDWEPLDNIVAPGSWREQVFSLVKWAQDRKRVV